MSLPKILGWLGFSVALYGKFRSVVAPESTRSAYWRGVEYRNFELTPDWQEKTEWAFARLMFPPGPLDGYRGRFDGDWRQGLSLWTQDYPRADRHFSAALRRLTRIHARSVEQPIDLEEVGSAMIGPGCTPFRSVNGA